VETKRPGRDPGGELSRRVFIEVLEIPMDLKHSRETQ